MVVAIAGGITIKRADAIAENTVNTSISNAANLFREFERQRVSRLALPAILIGNDPKFVAYIQEAMAGTSAAPSVAGAPPAPPVVDLVSIADQLEQRRQSLGTDLLILVDDQYRIVD